MSYDCVLAAWQAYEKDVIRFLARRSNPELAEDLLQEVFLKAMRQGEGFCELDQPRAWLLRVARTTLIDHRRLSRPGAELPAEVPAPASEESRPVDALVACLERNLPRLAEDDRAILEACDLGARTVLSFAEEQGLTLSAAKSRLLRARRRLRETLARNCQVHFDDSGRICCHVPPDSA